MNSISSCATLGIATINYKRIVRGQIAHHLRTYRMDVIKGLQVLDDQQGIVADFALENCAEIHPQIGAIRQGPAATGNPQNAPGQCFHPQSAIPDSTTCELFVPSLDISP